MTVDLRMVRILLRARLRMLVNTVRAPERRGWTLAGAAVIALVMLLAYRATAAALGEGARPPAEYQAAIAAGLGRLAGFVGVTSVTFALGSLYFARDLDMLRITPVSGRALLLSRMIAYLGLGAVVGALIVAPPLLAYLAAAGQLGILPLVALEVVAFAAMPVAAGTALTIAAVRVVPARRLRDAAGLLVSLVMLAVVGANLAVRGPDAVAGGLPSGFDPGTHVRTALDAAWLPTAWVARSLVAASSGRWLASAGWGLPVLVGGGIAPAAVAVLGEQAWLTGHRRSLEAPAAPRRRRAASRAVGSERPRPWVSILRKDLLEIRRDGSQLAQLLLPMALFALSIAAPHGSVHEASTTRLPWWFLLTLTAAFAGLFSAAGIALRGIGMEGSRLWILRTAPVGVRQLMTAKFLAGLIVAALLSEALLVLGTLRGQEPLIGALLPAVRLLVVLGGLVGLATGLGAARPRLDWTDPRRSVGLGVSFAFLAVGAAYLAACFVLLGVPYALPGGGRTAAAAADAGVAAVAALVAAASMRAGAARLGARDL